MMSSLPDVRTQHSVVTIENVGVYAIGGTGSTNSKNTSEFLPADSLQWTGGPVLPSDVSTSSYGCAVPVSNTSFIYINDGVIREYEIDIANPTSNAGWMDANRWPVFSSIHIQECARIGNYVLINGGFGNSGRLSSTKIIDIATRQVQDGGNMATPRATHQLATVTTGGLTKTFVLGGDDGSGSISSVEEWDEENLTWNPADDLEEARGSFAAITVPLSVVCPGSG